MKVSFNRREMELLMKRKMTKWYLMPVALVIGFFIGLFGLMLWLIR